MAKTTNTRKPALRNGPSIPPETPKIGQRRGRLPYYEPLRNLKAKEIEDTLRVEANRGLFARPAWTFHELAKVCSLVGDKVRFWKAQVAALDWRIAVAEEAQGEDADPKAAARAEAQRAALKGRYERIRNLKAAVKHLALARFYGFAVLRVRDAGLDPVDPWNVIHDVEWLTEREPTFGWYFNKRSEAMLWKDRMPRMEGCGCGYVIRESDDSSMVELMRLGLRAMRVMDFREKDLEAAAKRQVVALTGGNLPRPDSADAQERAEGERLTAALKAIRDGDSSVVAKGDPTCPTEVVFAPASRGLMYYNESLAQLDEWMTKAVTGGMLTMLAMPTGIGEGASQEHADTLAALVADEASGIMETLWRDVDEPTLRAAGLLEAEERPLAWFELGGKEKKDPGKAAGILVQLKQAGKKVEDGIASEMLGFEVTDAPEPAAPAAGGGFGFGGFGNRAEAFAAALRNRSGEYLANKRAVQLDGKFFDFLEHLANKYGGKAEADEEWLDKMAALVEEAPPESFVDSAALESWLEAKMRRGEKEGLKNTRDVNGREHGDHDGRFEEQGGGGGGQTKDGNEQARQLGYKDRHDLMAQANSVSPERIAEIVKGGKSRCKAHEAVAVLKSNPVMEDTAGREIRFSDELIGHYVHGQRREGNTPKVENLCDLPIAIYAVRNDKFPSLVFKKQAVRDASNPPRGTRRVYKTSTGNGKLHAFAYADSGKILGWHVK